MEVRLISMRIEYNRWKFFNFCEDRITPTEVLIPIHPVVTHAGFPHCLVKIKIAPPPGHCSMPPSLPHRHPATLTAAWPPSPPAGRALTAARPPPRAPGQLPPSPTTARRPHPALARSRLPPPLQRRRQPIASSRSERRPPQQRLPHDTPVPDLHWRPHFVFAHRLKH
jgi:hypothetical protein